MNLWLSEGRLERIIRKRTARNYLFYANKLKTVQLLVNHYTYRNYKCIQSIHYVLLLHFKKYIYFKKPFKL